MNTVSLQEYLKQLEYELDTLEEDKEYCQKTYAYMRQHISFCLKEKKYASLLELSPYFDFPENHPHFHLYGEGVKIHTMLSFLELELKFGKESFLSSVSDFPSFMAQYVRTVFALRRLELALGEQSMEDAVSYLTSIPLNIYAAKIITEREYFENFNHLYINLYHCMENYWSTGDKILWLHFLLEKHVSDSIILELASLYLEAGDFHSAYNTLIQITAPDAETRELISILKENLHA